MVRFFGAMTDLKMQYALPNGANNQLDDTAQMQITTKVDKF
jgi:hypothetical protein